jgi:hypothetical protein
VTLGSASVYTEPESRIKILFLSANPKDVGTLDLANEVRAISTRLLATPRRDMFGIQQEWAVRVSELQAHLMRHKPQIVHFSGHGQTTGEIILEDEAGESKTVPVAGLKQLFALLKKDIVCVVLNACFSKPQAIAIARNIPCVIGMSGAIGDRAAISFSASFYQALGFGRSIREAFDLACNEIQLNDLEGHNIPKLICKKGVDPKTVRLSEPSESEEVSQVVIEPAKELRPELVNSNERGPAGIRVPESFYVLSLPLWILREATAAVPQLRYAVGAIGIVAAIAIARALVTNLLVAVVGAVVLIVLMAVLVVFGQQAKTARRQMQKFWLVLVCFALLLFMATGSLVFSSVFFKWPVDLQPWIKQAPVSMPRENDGVPKPSPTPTPKPAYAWSTLGAVYHYSNCCWVKCIVKEHLQAGDTPPAGRSLHRGCPSIERDGYCDGKPLPECN